MESSQSTSYGTRSSFLIKKNNTQKSRDTVPLSNLEFKKEYWYTGKNPQMYPSDKAGNRKKISVDWIRASGTYVLYVYVTELHILSYVLVELLFIMI